MGRLGDIVESPVASRENSEMPALEKSKSHESNVEDLNCREAIAELKKLKPPKKRFLEVESAGELKLNEVDELLMDYRRLVKALGNAIAS